MHTISLRAPWTTYFEPVQQYLRYARSFHAPTNLGSDTVRIAIFFHPDGCQDRSQVRVQLNDELLPPKWITPEMMAYDLAGVMNPFNYLVVEVPYTPASEELPEIGHQIIRSLELQIVPQ